MSVSCFSTTVFVGIEYAYFSVRIKARFLSPSNKIGLHVTSRYDHVSIFRKLVTLQKMKLIEKNRKIISLARLFFGSISNS